MALSAALAAACASAQAPAPSPSPSSPAAAGSTGARKVDGATAAALVKAGARVVDVRTPHEFATGHVPGALNVPYDEIERRAGEIGPPASEVVLYCRTGRRSAVGARALEKLGYTKVYDMGSMSAWPSGDGAGAPARAQ